MESNHLSLITFGYASGLAAGDKGCQDGPEILKNSSALAHLAKLKLDWQPLLRPITESDKYAVMAELNQRLAEQISRIVKQQQPFLVIGGDHSCAIGTWSGVSDAAQAQGPIGLIWIDAHLDSHTPETSPSGNIHGMPLACLLGYGDKRLTEIAYPVPKLLPQHVCIIGARSYESGEQALLESLGVRIFYNEEVSSRGIKSVLQEALAIVQSGTMGYGLSIDIDALDPTDAPAVGTPEPNGISAQALCEALLLVKGDSELLGLEITEFNPHHDQAHKTEQWIANLITSVYAEN